MTPYMEVIAREWTSRAEVLADWTYAHLVNRTDVWGSYLSSEKRRPGRDFMFFTAPFPAARGKQFLTKAIIAKHFTGLDGHIISLHSTSADKTSRWLAIDIDRHDQDEASTPQGNLFAALAWHDRIAAMGFDPLLFDTNGNGGYHLFIVFTNPVRTADVFAFGQSIIADYAKLGLPREPETYPKQICTEEGHFGNCLRLPGRHHTRPHFTKVWCGEPGLQEWLEGAGAIDRILGMRLASIDLVPANTEAHAEPPKRSVAVRRNRPRVCVDLDGVLAEYDGWKGLDFTGAPIPGAVEFTRQLAEFADVVIFTTRCTVDAHREEMREYALPASDLAPRLAHNVRYWLEKHRFAFSEVFTGQGKPMASAYIDDRAVWCSPQKSKNAYIKALTRARELCANRQTIDDAPYIPPDERLKRVIENWDSLPETVRAAIAKKAVPKTKKLFLE